MKSEKSVSKAIETYDHLLWEAIIQVCGCAISKSFSCNGNRVRAVYEIDGPNRCSSVHLSYLDPRGHLQKIEGKIRQLIFLSKLVRKLGKKPREMNEAQQMCSRASYQEFLRRSVPPAQAGYINSWSQYREHWVYECDFVEIGNRDEENYICCPCVGEHLENTGDLAGFNIDLQEPKKVGRGTYEFRFEVSPKST